MKVGVVREIKADEYRVALTPAGARELGERGHDVLVETGAGEGSSFADGNNTLIYSATVRGGDRRAAGGVAVVFDACAQLNAMLVDALPHDEHGKLTAGCRGVLLDREGRVMCSTDPALEQSSRRPA